MTIAEAIEELNLSGVPASMSGTPTRISISLNPDYNPETKLMTLRQFRNFCDYFFEEPIDDITS